MEWTDEVKAFRETYVTHNTVKAVGMMNINLSGAEHVTFLQHL